GDDGRELPVALVRREALPGRAGRAAAEDGAVVGEAVPLGPVQRLARRGAGATLADLLGTQCRLGQRGFDLHVDDAAHLLSFRTYSAGRTRKCGGALRSPGSTTCDVSRRRTAGPRSPGSATPGCHSRGAPGCRRR